MNKQERYNEKKKSQNNTKYIHHTTTIQPNKPRRNQTRNKHQPNSKQHTRTTLHKKVEGSKMNVEQLRKELKKHNKKEEVYIANYEYAEWVPLNPNAIKITKQRIPKW